MRIKLISHALISHKNQYVLIKRSSVKRGKKNVYELYWDIPGGSFGAMELPRERALRETIEDAGLLIIIKNIIHEDSHLYKQKTLFLPD